MKATPQERISQHLALMVSDLQKLRERPPRSSQALNEQHMFADTAVCVALEVVCEVLPPEIQPTVKRLIELREEIWHRAVERGQEGSHGQ
jgi:hypothetical protein